MDLLNKNKKNKVKESVRRIIDKYPDRVPVFVTRGIHDRNLKDISNNKFIVPDGITVSQFMAIIRKKIELTPEMALFIFVNKDILPLQSSTMGQLYHKYKNDDGLLEIKYCGENTFGFI
jgi:GABA(A) receptor-associated protein